MKEGKASRSFEYLDDALIASAMNDCDLNGEEAHFKQKRRNIMKQNAMWKKWLAVAAVFAVMISAVIVIGQFVGGGSAGATIAFDVNPSLEIEVNEKEKVVEVHTFNKDAETVLDGMELEGVDLKVAVYAIMGSMVKHNYISVDQNSILISVNSENNKTAANLKDKLSVEVNAFFGENNIEGSVIVQNFNKNDETNQKAEENDISPAKATLVAKIVASGMLDANGVPYEYEVLAQLKVNELKLIIDSKEIDIEGVIESGLASLKKYASRDEALATALAQAKLNKEDVTKIDIEMDFDDDVFALVYEIEFVHNGSKYEYEIEAKKGGAILEEKIRPYDNDDDDEGLILFPEGCIGRLAALAKAYEHAKVSVLDVRRPEIELEREGTKYFYEIEFKANGLEYEYKLDAQTGDVIRFESEPID